MRAFNRSKKHYIQVPSGEKIAYLSDRRNEPSFKSNGIFWLGGFKSTMTGTKAEALSIWARENGRECIRFDYSGHGDSEGAFTAGTISKWLHEAETIFEEVATGNQIIIGSSMGGWLTLLLLRNHIKKMGLKIVE